MKKQEEKIKNESLKDSNNKLTIEQPIKHNFIMILDTIYKNNDLSLEEIGLLNKLIGNAPTFKPSHRKLCQILKIGDKQLRKIVNNLKQKGYLTIVKNGNKSEWNITQEPSINKIKELSAESLSDSLINYVITPKEVKQLHKLKYIDDLIYTETMKLYTQKLSKILKTEWLKK